MGQQPDTVQSPGPLGLVSGLALERVRNRLLGTPPVDTLIGRYRVSSRLGEGGMGVVYAAFDDDLERRVAVKVLRSSADGSVDHEAWLMREAQALARLNHPNVVHVYEVGSHDGHVFVAMELVEGKTLRQWVDETRPSTAQIVGRFLEAARGLAAAHAANVLHRDFKPDNALVGDDGRVRVVDFGLARRDAAEVTGLDTAPEGEDVTGRTGPGRLTMSGSVLGTPRYMAPEQHAGLDLTPAADQFSFCAALWGALVGTPAYAGDDVESLARAKQEGPPPWPRRRELRRVPRGVVSAIRRGLAPLPEDRWANMGALIDALEVAISSRGRNRLLAGAGAVAVVGLAVAVGAQMDRTDLCADAPAQLAEAWSAARRDQVEHALTTAEFGFAQATWDRISVKLDDYADGWTAQWSENCEATRVRGDQSSSLMDVRAACLQAARRELDATTDLLTAADGETLERADVLVASLPRLSRCADTERLLAGVEPPPDELSAAVNAARTVLARVKALHRAGKYDAASDALAPVVEVQGELGYRPLSAEVHLLRGSVLDRQGRYEDAEAALAKALEFALQTGQWDEAMQAVTSLVLLVGDAREETARGLSLATTGWGILPRTSAPASFEAELRRCIGAVHRTAEDYPQAEQELRRALVIADADGRLDPLAVSKIRHSLGLVLLQSGRFEEAERELRASLSLEVEVIGEEHPSVGKSLQNIAATLLKQGRLEEAEREYEVAVGLLTRALGPRHPTVGTARGNHASVVVAIGRSEEAVAEGREVLAIMEANYPPTHTAVLNAQGNLAAYIGATGRRQEALDAYREHLVRLEEAGLSKSHIMAAAHLSMAIQLNRLQRFEDSLTEARAGLAILEEIYDPTHPDLAEARGEVADALIELRRPEEALPYAEAAWSVFSSGNGLPETRASAGLSYARALWAQGAPVSRVRAVAEQARDILGDGSPRRATIQAWIDDLPRR